MDLFTGVVLVERVCLFWLPGVVVMVPVCLFWLPGVIVAVWVVLQDVLQEALQQS